MQKSDAIIHRLAVSRGLLPGCDLQHAKRYLQEAADRSFLDGGTQWTPLSAAIENRTLSAARRWYLFDDGRARERETSAFNKT